MLKKLLCLLLALMMVVSLVACDSGSDKDDDDDDEEIVDEKDKDEDEDKTEATTTEPERTPAELIVGTWVTYIDLSEQMETSGDMVGLETDVMLPIMITFDEDGGFTMALYGEEAEAAVDQLEADFVEYLVAALLVEFEQNGISAEELDESFQESFGMSVSEYFEEVVETSGMYEAFETAYSYEGEYEVDDEGMILTVDGEVFTVELDGDTLTFVDAENEEVLEEYAFTIPQEFTRVD